MGSFRKFMACALAALGTAGSAPASDAPASYQRPGGGATRLKTLETDSNYIKAALLLYQVTRHAAYLAKAERKYRAARRYFEDRRYPLYTVYLFDTGARCTQVPGQYFASVNGNMIWAGADLTRLTGNAAYLAQAIATARAVVGHLGDATGVYADLHPSVSRSPAVRLARSVLFAWRWPAPGRHTIVVAPAPFNAKQGGTFFHMTGYYLRS